MSLLGFGTGWQIVTGKAPPPPFSLPTNQVFLVLPWNVFLFLDSLLAIL